MGCKLSPKLCFQDESFIDVINFCGGMRLLTDISDEGAIYFIPNLSVGWNNIYKYNSAVPPL